MRQESRPRAIVGNRAYVVFQESSGPFWWTRFLHPGFGHCFVMYECRVAGPSLLAPPSTFLVDYTFGDLSLEIVSQPVLELVGLFSCIPKTASVLEVQVGDLRRQDYNLGNILLTCVGVSKAVLGIKSSWIQTPRQLHRHLLNSGGTEIYERHSKAKST